jgi:hypothetical protein
VSWTSTDLSNHQLEVTAMPGSALTCFGVEGQLARLYYLGPEYRVNELAWDPNNGKFVNTPL